MFGAALQQMLQRIEEANPETLANIFGLTAYPDKRFPLSPGSGSRYCSPRRSYLVVSFHQVPELAAVVPPVLIARTCQ